MNKPSGLRKWLRRGDDTTEVGAGSDTTVDGGRKSGDQSTGSAPSEDETHVEIIELDDASFDKGTEGAATIVDFWAAWCRPCTMFHPIFQRAADDHDGSVRFARCDIEASPRTAGMVGIQTIPTVALFDVDGNEVQRLSGAPSPRDLDRLIALGVELTNGA